MLSQTISSRCPDCQRNAKALALRLAKQILAGKAENLLLADVAVASVGEDVQRFLKAVQAVAERWEMVRSFSGSRENRLKKLDQLEIGTALSVPMDSYDDKLNRNRVKRELERLGVHNVFPGERGGFRAFVRAVTDGIDEGFTPEKIARQLWMARPGAIKAA